MNNIYETNAEDLFNEWKKIDLEWDQIQFQVKHIRVYIQNPDFIGIETLNEFNSHIKEISEDIKSRLVKVKSHMNELTKETRLFIIEKSKENQK